MKSHILCCFLAILFLANTPAVAEEDPKAPSAETASVAGNEPEKNDAPAAAAQAEVKKERLYVQYFRVYYEPEVEADQLSGIDALCMHMLSYSSKYEDGKLEPQFKFREYSNGARGIVWFER